MATRSTMDVGFADRMRELGAADDAITKTRWQVTGTFSGLDQSCLPRLVLIACGTEPGKGDAWFWDPFVAKEETFPTRNAALLHSALASVVLSRRIRDGEELDARLVRLAQLQGLEPDPLLPEHVDAALTNAELDTPSKIETPTVSGAAPDESPAALHQATHNLMASVNQAIGLLVEQHNAVASWAVDIEIAFRREQAVMQWLLAGRRADGKQWGDIPVAQRAVDAGIELADLLASNPQGHHEAILDQVLAVSETADTAVKIGTTGHHARLEVTDEGLKVLTPINSGTAGKLSPYAAARRSMWERTTLKLWAKSRE